MKKLILKVELTYNDEIMHGDDTEEIEWFLNDVLLKPQPNEQLILHSNAIGDEVGEIKVLSLEEVVN